MRRSLLTVMVLLLGVVLSADTLVLRDGRRVQGRLVGVDQDAIDFEERSGTRRVVRTYDKQDVLRIEFDRLGNNFVEEPGRPNGGGRPNGLREKLMQVAANHPWSDSGITVRSGQEIWLESSGRVQWGRDRRHGPGGEPNSPRNDARPIPTRNAAALIGKVGEESTDFFFIGDTEGPIRMRSSGRLFLGINDDFLQDNSGSFRVVIHY